MADVREAHPSDAPIPESTERIKLGEPLPETEYATHHSSSSTTTSLRILDGSDQDTFHPFPRCPTELRLKIWKYAIDEPRTIRHTLQRYGNVEFYEDEHQYRSFSAPVGILPPGVLQANCESRHEAQKVVEWNAVPRRYCADFQALKYIREDIDIAYVQMSHGTILLCDDVARAMWSFSGFRTLHIDLKIWQGLLECFAEGFCGYEDWLPREQGPGHFTLKCETLAVLVKEEKNTTVFAEALKDDWASEVKRIVEMFDDEDEELVYENVLEMKLEVLSE